MRLPIDPSWTSAALRRPAVFLALLAGLAAAVGAAFLPGGLDANSSAPRIGSTPALAEDDEEEDAARKAEQEKLAKAALEKAVLRGREIWDNKDGSMKKSCASCHDDANKPLNQMKNRTFSYPAYSRKRKAVVTMQQKLQDMITSNSRGKALDPEGTDIAALEAYVMSVKTAK